MITSFSTFDVIHPLVSVISNVLYTSYSVTMSQQFSFSRHFNFVCKAIFYICICIAMPIMTSSICMCNHQPEEGPVFLHWRLSTSFSRSLKEPTCLGGENPCHMFVTLPEEATTAMFINFQIHDSSCRGGDCQPVVVFTKD